MWEQHVTFVEDEDIREVALGGPDTATRTREVWQVRSMPVGTRSTASPPMRPGMRSSRQHGAHGGRAEPASVPVDPCVVPASAGIAGCRTGSIASRSTRRHVRYCDAQVVARQRHGALPVEEINVGGSAARVRLRSLGRDESLSLKIGDWVEVLHDDNELAGVPGLLTQVSDVDEDDLIVTLANPARDRSGTAREAAPLDSASAIRLGPSVGSRSRTASRCSSRQAATAPATTG